MSGEQYANSNVEKLGHEIEFKHFVEKVAVFRIGIHRIHMFLGLPDRIHYSDVWIRIRILLS
jgi:hypothetical protein